MRKKIIYTALFMVVLITSLVGFAGAGDNAEFSRDLEQQIQVTRNAINGVPAADTTSAVEDEYYLRRFWFRLRAKVGIKLPPVLAIQIVPEMEMLFERPVPTGYATYKP